MCEVFGKAFVWPVKVQNERLESVEFPQHVLRGLATISASYIKNERSRHKLNEAKLVASSEAYSTQLAYLLTNKLMRTTNEMLVAYERESLVPFIFDIT